VWDDTDYYIATSAGIYKIDSSNSVTSLVTGNFKGIIRVGSPPYSIIAVTKNGTLYWYDTSSFIKLYEVGADCTGAICSWNDGVSTRLLLLGIIGSSSTRGYREVDLDSSWKPTGGGRTPGTGSPSTVQSKPKYDAAIGKRPVYSIRQVPGSIFASTYKDGLWSLRGDQWNAED
jgi:hypothetical protein